MNDVFDYTPIIVAVITAIGGAIVVGGFAVWNRRHGNREAKAPSVEQLWEQQEKDRAARRRAEALYEVLIDLYYDLRAAFRAFYRRANMDGGFELTTREQAALDRLPPSLDHDGTDGKGRPENLSDRP